MGESIGIDSLLGGWAMPKAYSGEMRERVITEVESGASRREAAEEFAVSASTAVIWVKCFRQTGRCAAKPRGGSISPLEKHADFLLGLIEKQPDLTLDEVVLAMRKHKIPGGRTAVWRFFKRHKITFKKKPARSGARARGRGAGAPPLDARTGHVGSRSIGLRRRDRRQYQDGAAEWSLPAWRAPDWPCAAGALEDHHLCGRASPQWHESAVHCCPSSARISS